MRWSLWYLNHRRIPNISSAKIWLSFKEPNLFYFWTTFWILVVRWKLDPKLRILLRDKLFLWIINCWYKIEKLAFREIDSFRQSSFSVIRFFFEKIEFSSYQIFWEIICFCKLAFSQNRLFGISNFRGIDIWESRFSGSWLFQAYPVLKLSLYPFRYLPADVKVKILTFKFRLHKKQI